MIELNEFVFRMKGVMRAAEGDAGAGSLDSLSLEILSRVGDAHIADETLIVGDIIGNEAFGSPATAHGRLKKLTKQGWLKLADDPEDGRRKILRLSDKAVRMYNKMSSGILRLAQKHRG
ncbi:MAG: winged helix DNA-binding protein [Aestuariivirgaceae bacterium]|nr:winged helix DNA-binding protein [Aestuariivirgaceae bacterium]